ncbi:MAG: lipopolysaccharide biosynthesis protein, partial [Myxococcales bacterium]|nr:lipopolysaccharide biosynthesis protein [Myxococcales bacterium]
MSDLERRAMRGVFWTVLQAVASRSLSFLVFIVLARLLVPADFGLVAMAGVFIALLELLVQQGFSVAITQREDLEPEHESTAFWTNIAFSVLLAAAFWLAAEPVAMLYETPALAPVVRWLSAVLPLRGLAAVPVGLLQRHLRFRALAIRSIFGALVGGVAGVVAAIAGWGVYALVVQQLVAGLVDVVTVWSAAAWWPRFTYSFRHLLDLVGFSAHIVGAGLLDVLNRRSDDFLIGFFLGDVALGLYAVAYRVLLVLTQVLAKPGTLVAFTAFSRLQADRDRIRSAFYQSTRAASVISMPIFIGIALVAPLAAPLIFGDKYQQSGLVLQLLALAGVVHAIGHYNSSVYLGVGRPDVRLKLLLINTVVHVAVLLLVVRWGIEAVAAAVVAQVYLLIPLDLFALRRLIG